MAGKAINQYNTFSGDASSVNVLVQETSQTDPNSFEHKKANLATLIKTVASVDDVVEGYYYNGSFYEESTHTTVMTSTTGRIYIDLGDTGELYRYSGSAYVTITDNALRSALTNGSVTVDKATKDASGNTISTTYATKSELNAEKYERKAVDSQHDARISNLEQKAGDYSIVQYRGTDAVPTGKAKYGLVKSIVGKTRAWNQLVLNGNFESTDYWQGRDGDSVSASDNVITVSTSSGSLKGLENNASWVSAIAGHKYLLLGSIKSSVNGTADINFNTYDGGTSITAGQWTSVSRIITRGTTSNTAIYFLVNGSFSSSDTIQYKNIILRDLTLIFGSGNEPSTVADALAQLPVLGQYDAYDAGSLVDTTVTGVEAIGFNMMDKTASSDGYFITGIGLINPSTGRSCSDFMPILPNTDYYMKATSAISSQFTFHWYDADKNWIGRTGGEIVNAYYTSPNNAFYCRINYLTADADNVCFNLSQPNTLISPHNGDYLPYQHDTLSLPETVTLRSAGSVAEVLDVETGEVPHPVREYTFTGNESWTKIGSDPAYYSDIAEISSYIKKPTSSTAKCGAVASFGIEDTYVNVNGGNSDSNAFAIIYSNGRLVITATMYSNISSLTGQKIIFPLETPDPSTNIGATPNNFVKVQPNGTIETIQTQTPVIDNCLDVGYLAV